MKPKEPKAGDRPAGDAGVRASREVSRLMPEAYDELRRLARHYLRRERAGQSLQATALVNEAYLRLKKDKRQPWQDHAHFVAIAASSMRQILVDRARARAAAKRGGSRIRITLDEAVAAGSGAAIELLALDEALTRLAEFDPEQARIIELRFFGGLSVEECAQAMDISTATVKRGWAMARAWLKGELQGGGGDGT